MNENEAAARVTKATSPLWMPHGSVRAVLAIGLVLALVGLMGFGIEPGPIETLAAAAVAFYFGSKNGHPK